MPSVAILGASANRAKFGNKAVRAFQCAGWRVHPVNPRESSVEGIATFASVEDLPERVDVLSVYLPPAVTMGLVDKIADAQPHAIWLNPGADAPEVIEALDREALAVTCQCSIVALGFSPADFPG
jgi:uncharacterized protein